MTTSDNDAVGALIRDLQSQLDQIRTRGIKNNAGQPYNPAHFKRGLAKAIDAGDLEVVEFVRRLLYKPPSDCYTRLENASALDLACESLVHDTSKPYAHLFTDDDREAARQRLGPNIEAIEERKAKHRARIDAARAKLRANGLPSRLDLDGALRSPRRG